MTEKEERETPPVGGNACEVHMPAKKTPASSKRQIDRPERAAYSILFGEPYVSGNDGKVFKVTADFYNVLRKKPKALRGDFRNAYIFGRRFPRHEYRPASGHGNDGAQTGLLDVTGASKAEIEKIRSDQAWHEIYGAVEYDWDDRKALRAIRKRLSERILFVGETVGGDVGAELYLHKDSNGHIDGAIIDNQYVFPMEDDEPE